MSDIFLRDVLADGDLLRRVGASPEGISPSSLAQAMGAPRMYVHNGASYALSSGRIFVGPEDPSDDGVIPQPGDIWMDPS